ncbi:MAG: LamG domain-containing protein [Solirubrobacterales bacterium]
MGVVFRGKHAGISNVTQRIGFFTEALDPGHAWIHGEDSDPQGMQIRQDGGGYQCEGEDASRAEAKEIGFNSRFHIRLWFVPSTLGQPEVKTIGTPHHEDFVSPAQNSGCKGKTGFGNHAIDENGAEGSGFDKGRRRLAAAFRLTTTKLKREFWGNTEKFPQCDGGVASSNGWGVVIYLPHGAVARTKKVSGLKVTSATLKGTIASEEPNIEWWFEYGRHSAQGNEYPHKTSVETTSSAGEVDVSQASGDLTPGATYFVRLLSRDAEGEIEEGNEVEYTVPAPGPVAAYSFDAGGGGVAADVTGNKHDATIEGATWSTDGKFGSALNFDGENDCLTVPESAELQFLETEEFTLEAWVRPSTAGGLQAILTQEDEASGEEEPFSYSLLTGAEEEASRGWLREGGTSGHQGVSGGEPIPAKAWSHLAFTDDGARLRIYVDGELAGTQPAVPLTATSGPLTIGCLAQYGNYFKGRIDEVRIYDRALDNRELVE